MKTLTNDELLTIFNTDKQCPDAPGLVSEMLDRNLLNGYVLYTIEQHKAVTYYMDTEDLIQIGLIEIYRRAKKYKPGLSTMKTYAIMCVKSEYLRIITQQQTDKRAANLNTVTGESLDDFLIESPVNVEKYVIRKLEMEHYLSVLKDKERTAIIMKSEGYKDIEIAKVIGYNTRSAVNKLIHNSYDKIRRGAVEWMLNKPQLT